jgi:TPR repeat protein
MWRALPIIGLLWLSCSKCSLSEPAVPKAVPLPAACTEAFFEVAPLALCEEKCAAGDGEACVVAGDQHRRGLRTRRDQKLGLERARRSCELGSASGCASVASSYLSAAIDGADGGAPELSKFEEFDQLAIKHAERECTEGRARSCERLFFWYQRLERVNKKDNPQTVVVANRALELYRAGCDRGDWFMCRRLALSLKVGGMTGSRDEAAATKMYEKACRLGDAVACRDAFPDDADDSVSAAFLTRGCELGDSSACFLWSLRLSGSRANEVLARSCELGDVLGCRNLGRALTASGDAEGAKKALQSACEMDDSLACP